MRVYVPALDRLARFLNVALIVFAMDFVNDADAETDADSVR
jgi:hypothetical protein